MSDVTLTIQIAEALQRQVQAAADLRGETLSDVVNSALEIYVKGYAQANVDAATALKTDPLLSLRFSGGPGDVAERVEDILQEASDRDTGFKPDDDRTH